MKKTLLLGAVALILILAAGYLTNRYQIDEAEAAAGQVWQSKDTEGEERVDDFTLRDLAGNPVSLSDYKGRIVYLNFWATWCKWCKKEMPDMEKIHQSYDEKDVVILAVSVGEERGKVANYIGEYGYSFRVLLDPDKKIAQAYRVKPIPESFFIDRDGNIAYRKLGYMTEEGMRVQLDALLAKPTQAG